MSLRPVVLPPNVPGRMWLSSMPGRFETWPSFEAQAQRAKLALVVCLTPRAEVAELSPRYHAAVAAGTVPFRWLHLPIRNFGAPDDGAGFRREVGAIADALRRGDAVLLHCAAGMGRTGTAAACVLKALGLDTDNALQRVRDAGSNPQNAAQSGVVGWF
ncbi:tyrosine-protein phosphatase [Ramlibacter sp.]|uniref:protein-tyrosine phosphatase family protein n=1 Tax=Ramlibacter sp. TaxID=1917967 RepID=UPI0017A8829D|nr:tyrosine-protein phosphatase [Ramlibacter sp.]MBA2675402.1 tyrosine-protein phosphatase [Ramlibacter sp.]